MFRAAEMRKVRVFALRTALPELIAALHNEGIVEITRGGFTGLDEGRPLEFFSVVSEQLVRMRAINAILVKYASKKHDGTGKLLGAEAAVGQARSIGIEDKLKGLVAEMAAKDSEMARLRAQMAVVDRLLPFSGIDFSRLETRTLAYSVGDVKAEKLASLKGVLERDLADYNLVQPAGSRTALLLYKKGGSNPVQALSAAGFEPIEIPAGTTTPAQTRAALEKAYSDAQARVKEAGAELASISDANLGKVHGIIRSLEVEADRAEVTSGFGFSRSMAVFEGWVLKSHEQKLAQVVAKFGDKATMSEVKFGHDEQPPVVLANPALAGPFEFITKSYSMPNYYELDPTIFYAIGLMVIMGMIIGDVVYGIATVLFSMWLIKKFQKSYVMSNVSKIWLYGGFSAMAFGLLFDEWAGFHQNELFELLRSWGLPAPESALWEGFNRMENIQLLVALTAGIGLVHLFLAFLIGAYSEWGHNKKHAAAKIAWIGVEVGGVLALGAMAFGLLPALYGTVGLALVGISVLALAVTEGITGLLELPGLVGNILSYARIAAIGVAGVALAELINQYFAPNPAMGLFIIVAIPLFLALHFANMVLAIFEALIQGGRLNIIEFRYKFLHGGGREFAPFSLTK
jgi:V/A-type H+-transporting ATPase subunit I